MNSIATYTHQKISILTIMLVKPTTKHIAIMLLLSSTYFTAFSQSSSKLYYFTPNRLAIKTLYDGQNNAIATQEYKLVSTDKTNSNKISGRTVKYKKGEQVDEILNIFVDGEDILLISMGASKNGELAFLDYPMQENPKHNIITELYFSTTSKFAGKVLTVSCTIKDRKILATNEVVKTPLGAWNCLKIGYEMEIRSFGIPINVYVVEWFSNAIGIVRTDVYKGGKLHEKRLLTEFK